MGKRTTKKNVLDKPPKKHNFLAKSVNAVVKYNAKKDFSTRELFE